MQHQVSELMLAFFGHKDFEGESDICEGLGVELSYSQDDFLAKANKHDGLLGFMDEEGQSNFIYLAMASCGEYYSFLVNNDESLENQPVVYFGSEGEISIVAADFKSWLSVLSLNNEPSGDNGDIDSAFYCYDDDALYDADKRVIFIQWLKDKNIPAFEGQSDEEFDAFYAPIKDRALKYREHLENMIGLYLD